MTDLDCLANELAKQIRLAFRSSEQSVTGFPELRPIGLHRHQWRGYVHFDDKEIVVWDTMPSEWQSYDPVSILLNDPNCFKKLKKEVWKRTNRSKRR